jgi:hypothetical protein
MREAVGGEVWAAAATSASLARTRGRPEVWLLTPVSVDERPIGDNLTRLSSIVYVRAN